MRFLFLLLSLFLAGCATSTLEKRKAERRTVYQSLTLEFKTLVDEGRIKAGMTADAVYLAWGKPSEIVTAENPQGPYLLWLYKEVYLQPHSYWAFRPDHWSSVRSYYGRGRPEGIVLERRLEHSYESHEFVKAEVEFVNGAVTHWRERSRPR